MEGEKEEMWSRFSIRYGEGFCTIVMNFFNPLNEVDQLALFCNATSVCGPVFTTSETN